MSMQRCMYSLEVDKHGNEDSMHQSIVRVTTAYVSVAALCMRSHHIHLFSPFLFLSRPDSNFQAVAALMFLHNHELHGRSMKVAFSKTVL